MAWRMMLLDFSHVAQALGLTTLPANSVAWPVRMLSTILLYAQLCLESVQAYLL